MCNRKSDTNNHCVPCTKATNQNKIALKIDFEKSERNLRSKIYPYDAFRFDNLNIGELISIEIFMSTYRN